MGHSCLCLRLLLSAVVLVVVQNIHPVLASLDRLRKYQRECFDDIIPCIMFMDEEQAYGCAQCGDDTRTELVREFVLRAEVLRFLSPENDRRILMMPEFVFFFTDVLTGLRQATNVAAVIVYEQTGDVNDEPLEYPPIQNSVLSTDYGEPNQKYNYYPAASTSPEAEPNPTPMPRNAVGVGSKFVFFPFNIFRINATLAETIRQRMERFPSKNGVSSSQEDNTNRSAISPTSPRYKLQSVGQMYACPSVPVPTPNSDEVSEEPASGLVDLAPLMDSKQCLADKTCLPIGGQSLWSALEHVDASVPSEERKVLAITAPMDSISFFPDLALGASAEIASLAVLMAVAQTVSEYRRAEKGKGKQVARQPVYFVWNAQSWGYTGSSRFLKDLDEFECISENDASKYVKGCANPFMDSLKFRDFKKADFAVLNIGQLTSPVVADPTPTFQFYKQGGREKLEGSTELEEALDAAFAKRGDALDLDDGRRQLTPIDASQSFRRYMPKAEVITVSNYDRTFTNVLYHSMYDNETLILEKRPLYAAADAIANAVISVAFGDPEAQERVDTSVIDRVLTCMTARNGWSGCDLAKEYLGSLYNDTKAQVIPGNYPGSFFPSTRLADTNPSGALKLAFIRSFLAFHNRYDVEEEEVECTTRAEDEQDCRDFIKKVNERVQATTHSELRTAFCTKGRCVASDTYTHNAFGPALNSTNEAQSSFTYNNETAPGRQSDTVVPGATPLEAAWTESVWDSDLGLCGYVEDTPLFGGVILGLGIFMFISSIGIAILFEYLMFIRDKKDPRGLSIAATSPRWAADEETPV